MMEMKERSRAGSRGVALVLAGAVAKGAFHAGALSVIAEMGLRVTKVVGTSAGAINGCVYAAGVRAGREREAAARLVQRWRDRADWDDVFSAAPGKLLAGRGISSTAKIRQMLKEAVQGWTPKDHAIGLDLVVSPLHGTTDPRSDGATTYEHLARFRGEDFDTSEGWDRVVSHALASAAFPVVFAPEDLPGLGPCVDGGAVNNTPIAHAIDRSGTDLVIVVDPHPERARAEAPIAGLNLGMQLANILIHERLFRDLKLARSVNDKLDRLDALVREGRLSAAAREDVVRAFNWRRLHIVPIRPAPERALPGSAFAAFFNAEMRRQYVESGMEEARAALSGPLAAGLFGGTASGEAREGLRASA